MVAHRVRPTPCDCLQVREPAQKREALQTTNVRPAQAETERLLQLVQKLQRAVRDRVISATQTSSSEELASVANDEEGDTIFAIDKVSEDELMVHLEPAAASFGGFVLVAEGVHGGEVCLPHGIDPVDARYRIVVDPIDGTRGLMYQKRSAWVLTGVAPNRGKSTRLSDVFLAVQTEIPTLKQHLCDELSAIRGQGVQAKRYDVLTGKRRPFRPRPSTQDTVKQGFAMISRFFPGAREELAAIDEAVMLSALGPSPPGKALCFEEQYASTGGQFYELLAGHDRFNADLRPLMADVLKRRGLPKGLCCHPYDACTALIAEECGVILTDPSGAPLDVPLDVDFDVAWVGYANDRIRAQIEPALHRVLKERGLL